MILYLKRFVRLTVVFFQLHIARIGVQYPPGVEPPSLVLPLVYDIHSNVTQLAEKRDSGPAPATTAANLLLKRYTIILVSVRGASWQLTKAGCVVSGTASTTRMWTNARCSLP